MAVNTSLTIDAGLGTGLKEEKALLFRIGLGLFCGHFPRIFPSPRPSAPSPASAPSLVRSSLLPTSAMTMPGDA